MAKLLIVQIYPYLIIHDTHPQCCRMITRLESHLINLYKSQYKAMYLTYFWEGGGRNPFLTNSRVSNLDFS